VADAFENVNREPFGQPASLNRREHVIPRAPQNSDRHGEAGEIAERKHLLLRAVEEGLDDLHKRFGRAGNLALTRLRRGKAVGQRMVRAKELFEYPCDLRLLHGACVTAEQAVVDFRAEATRRKERQRSDAAGIAERRERGGGSAHGMADEMDM
jgi:hypothetical protein